jgi:hypothetical protein
MINMRKRIIKTKVKYIKVEPKTKANE